MRDGSIVFAKTLEFILNNRNRQKERCSRHTASWHVDQPRYVVSDEKKKKRDFRCLRFQMDTKRFDSQEEASDV
jgi:hypothetical protein